MIVERLERVGTELGVVVPAAGELQLVSPRAANLDKGGERLARVAGDVCRIADAQDAVVRRLGVIRCEVDGEDDRQGRIAADAHRSVRRGGDSRFRVESHRGPPVEPALAHEDGRLADAAAANAERLGEVAAVTAGVRPDVDGLAIGQGKGVRPVPGLETVGEAPVVRSDRHGGIRVRWYHLRVPTDRPNGSGLDPGHEVGNLLLRRVS